MSKLNEPCMEVSVHSPIAIVKHYRELAFAFAR